MGVAESDLVLAELLREQGASFGPSTIWRCLDRHGRPLKLAHAAEQERPDVAARRRAWFAAQPDINPKHLWIGFVE